jgi:hypothetical protein
MNRKQKRQNAPPRGVSVKQSNSGKPNMTSKVFEISRGNLNDAIELFLRQNSIINDDQTVTDIDFSPWTFKPKGDRKELLSIKLTLKQEATVISHNGT